MYVCTYVCMYVCMYVCVYICVCAYMHTNLLTYHILIFIYCTREAPLTWSGPSVSSRQKLARFTSTKVQILTP